jgi:maltose alpha-D-glucosyltransferase/alpha-amylase
MPETLWFKDAVIYELHVRSFSDSTGDGIGDFRGLRDRLGYFQDLGVTALWLLPFYPSPLRDDGYDIADYYSVNPSYGTHDDFRRFLDEAHRRDLRVITELVINHTSDQHAWFQRARRAPDGSPERDFYVWSDTPKRFEEARIIFKDFESSNWAWDPVAQAYFWHRFYSHQPDLNFDNPAVREAVLEVMDFWLGLGVDGLRLDAIPYLFEREGTSCENLPETHAYLAQLRTHVDRKFPGTMLLAEANQWPEDAVKYFGAGDECHMSFHFPLMPRLFMGIQMEDRFPIIDILEQTPEIPDNCQWAIFLRNHDELTLEMVTDEERDYMYRLYAEDPRARINLGIRRRLAPLLDNNRRKIELINSLLLSLPGTPIIYYGDEIGMGDNFYLGDRNGVRTPMQWNSDRNAGFSRANPQQLFLPVIIDPEFHYEAINVDTQVKNLSSLFWWMRRVIDIRKRHPAFSQGSIEFLRPSNAKVLAYLRRHESETILVVANLSRFSQAVSIDLAGFAGSTAQELFSGDTFLEIPESPAPFTVGPHGFYWLQISTGPSADITAEKVETPTIGVAPVWSPALLDILCARILPAYLPSRRWFGHKQRTLRAIRTVAAPGEGSLRVLILELAFSDGESSTQVMPLAIGEEAEADSVSAVLAHFADGKALLDALSVPACRQAVWNLMAEGRAWEDETATVFGRTGGEEPPPVTSRILGGEQSNTTVAYEDRHLLKFLRQFEPGRHPDAEILRVLTENGFPHTPRLTGEICCRLPDGEGLLGVMTEFVKNEGDGWTQALDAISRFFERVAGDEMQEKHLTFEELAGTNFSQRAYQLGARTGALHSCLASLTDLPNFAPEPFTSLFQRSLYQSMRSQLRRTEAAVTRKLSDLDLETRQQAMNWIAATPQILEAYGILLKKRFPAQKIRVHGDYHLGQVLNTGNDFVILDFEGEPRKGLGERLLKRSPLVDVAGMLRSFDYAVEASLLKEKDPARLRPWASRWLDLVSSSFLEGYLEETAGTAFLPEGEDFRTLLNLFILDKVTYEIGYELNYRPSFIPIPISGASRLLLSHSAA